jgi:hypothetical protein
VQSHFSNGSFIGSFAATSPWSLLRTGGESSQTVELGATLVFHMSSKMLRKAFGNSLKTIDANLKQFSSSSVYWCIDMLAVFLSKNDTEIKNMKKLIQGKTLI